MKNKETYSTVRSQIEELEKKAEQLRQTEIAGVIERIKLAIRFYNITIDDLGIDDMILEYVAKHNLDPEAKMDGANTVAVKFRDENGNAWAGRGKRPNWLMKALASGRKLEEFAIDRAAPATSSMTNKTAALQAPAGTPSSAVQAAARTSNKNPGKTIGKATMSSKNAPARQKYKNPETGATWNGIGPKPGWYRQMVSQGHTPESLQT